MHLRAPESSLPQGVEDSVVAMFGDPVQHGEAGDEVPLVEQRGVVSEQRVDVGPGARCALHYPGVLVGIQRKRRLLTRKKKRQTETRFESFPNIL